MLKSRKSNLIGKICLIILLGWFCSGLSITKIEASQPAPLTSGDLKLSGLSLGSSIDEIIEKYGKPDKIKEYEFLGGFGGSRNPIFIMYNYQDGLLEVHFLKSNNTIIEIKSRASNVFTPRNVAAGYLDKDMFALYGNNSVESKTDDGNLIYSYSPAKSIYALDFEVNPHTHQIVSISINSWAD